MAAVIHAAEQNDPMETQSLLDLPRPFLSQLLDELGEFEAARSLLLASKTAFQLVFELKPGALVLWGSHGAVANKRLQQLLPLGGLRALLIPDSDETVILPDQLQLPGLKTAVVNYRFSAVRTLFSSAGPLDSIIIRGWQLHPHVPLHLASFLQQLQDCSSLQKLVLTIPCTSATAAAALGQLSSLRSLRMCVDVSRDSANRLREVSYVNWTAACWAGAIQPLTGLTSLQLKLPVVLKAQDNLGLEWLGQLRRLELMLDKPSHLETLAGGAQAASLFLQQPGLPALQHLTRLVLTTTYQEAFPWEMDLAAQLMHPPDDTMHIVGQLTNLVSLDISPNKWKFSLQQLQQLSGCCKLTELVVAQLAMGFAEPGRIDENGIELSTEEKAVVQAAMAASAALHKQQQGTATADASLAPNPKPMQGDQGSTSPPPPPPAAAAAAANGPTSSAAAAAYCSCSSGGSNKVSKVVRVNGCAVQVPLLPQLTVLRATSLWWRLPLCVLSARLEDVAYKRLDQTSYNSFVLPDLQTQQAVLDMPPFGPLPGPPGALLDVPDLIDNLFDVPQGDGAGWPLNGLGPPGPALGGWQGLAVAHQQQQQEDMLDGDGMAAAMPLGDYGAMEGDLGPPAAAAAAEQQQQEEEQQALLNLWQQSIAVMQGGDEQQQQQQQQHPQLALMQHLQQEMQGMQQEMQGMQHQLEGGNAAAAAVVDAGDVVAAEGGADMEIDSDGSGVDPTELGSGSTSTVGSSSIGAGGSAAAWGLGSADSHEHAAASTAAAAAAVAPSDPAAAGEGVPAVNGGDTEGHAPVQPPSLVASSEHGVNSDDSLSPDDVDYGMVPFNHPGIVLGAAAMPLPPPAAAAAGQGGVDAPWPAPSLVTDSDDGDDSLSSDDVDYGVVPYNPHGGAPPPGGRRAAAAAAAAAAPVPLGDAPADKVYADVLRGLQGLRTLDVDVTGLCKVVKLTSSPLAGVRELRLHMLGTVNLPPGGLPRLPSLTHLEFYLPDEHNWADYNDHEDLALWRHQSNVRQVAVRGTFHAGGFFARGHLALARRSMPHITRLMFVKCRDLQPERLQEVVDSRLSPLIELVQGSNFGPGEDDQQQQGSDGGDVAMQAAGADTDGEMSWASQEVLSELMVMHSALAVAAAGDGGGAAAATEGGMALANANIALGLGANAPGVEAVAAGNLGNTADMEVNGGAANAWDIDFEGPSDDVAEPQGMLAATGDVAGPATGAAAAAAVAEQVMRARRARAQARAALRERKLRAVAAAAAEVGVVVKMLPALEWQKWYHEMLA